MDGWFAVWMRVGPASEGLEFSRLEPAGGPWLSWDAALCYARRLFDVAVRGEPESFCIEVRKDDGEVYWSREWIVREGSE
jgi:hypothetical protein